MNIVYKFLAGVIGVAVLVASVLTYFVRTFDKTGVVYDGFGRVPGWHMVDVVWFFGGIGLVIFLLDLGDND